jgi:hypothetical protein
MSQSLGELARLRRSGAKRAAQRGAAPDAAQRRRVVAPCCLAAWGLPRAVLGGRWAAKVSTDLLLYAVVMSRRRRSHDDAG